MKRSNSRAAWIKMNAYGLVLACLTVLSLLDLLHPAKSELARLVGAVPPGQTWWILGYAAAGVLMLIGFARIDRVAESLGLGVMLVTLVVQTCVALSLIGWTDYTLTRLALVAIIGFCTWARVSVLWSRGGLSIVIPPRGLRRGGRS